MRPKHTIAGIIAAAALAASVSLALAQTDGSSGPTRPGPTPAPSSGMPSDLDTTGMGGTQPDCVAPPGGTASSTGGDLRTPANAGALRSSKTGDEAHGGAGHATETSEPLPKSSSTAKTSGC
ncbi:MAG TPA: hypothetical protein VKD43_07440 [Xanthobacteraceae bacterium]|nr:hypothetical protein [Xanthobacteraceae bacterium]